MKEFATVLIESTGEYEEKKSKFIGVIAPVSNENEALSFIQRVKKQNPAARHNSFAYRLTENGTTRFSDDGEPQGTAGKPLLDLIEYNGLYDVIVVVTRYFGGILLGPGGLKRAYFAAAKAAFQNNKTAIKREALKLSLSFDYSYYNGISGLAEETEAEITEKDFSGVVRLAVVIRAEKAEDFKEKVINLTNGTAKISLNEKFLYFFKEKK